jgi:predicted dehydrogenase
LQYAPEKQKDATRTIRLKASAQTGKVSVGVLGAGNFARMVLIPKIVQSSMVTPRVLCSSGGVSAAHTGAKQGFERVTSDEQEVFSASDVDAVFSITQHHLHAAHALAAIEAGKHLFIEKPLCLTLDELKTIQDRLAEKGEQAPMVMVGFNRRFAPLAQKLKAAFAKVDAPLTCSFRFNAGEIPSDHWTQIDELGGGRIIGEACHAIDFVTWVTGSLPVRVYAESIGGKTAPEITDDQCFITVRHANGSVSNIAYLAGGDKACPKERVEVFGGGVTGILDDFRTLTTYVRGKRVVEKAAQDKGHGAEVDAFLSAVKTGGESPISWGEIRSVTTTSILAVQSLRQGGPLLVDILE